MTLSPSRPAPRRLATRALLSFPLLAALPAAAQVATYDHAVSATATGAGAIGVPSMSFNVTAGSNRIIFLSGTFERDHCTTDTTATSGVCTRDPAPNLNFASPNYLTAGGNNQIQFLLTGPGGSLTVTNPLAQPNGDLRFLNVMTQVNGSTLTDTVYSMENYFTAVYESQIRSLLGGASAGTISVTLPNVASPHRGGDEGLLQAVQFNQVSQRSDGGTATGIVRSFAVGTTTDCNTNAPYTFGITAPGTGSVCSSGFDAGQAPLASGDGLLVFGFNGNARTAPYGFQPMAGFTQIANPVVLNTDPSNVGTAGAHYRTGAESDGFSATFQYANGAVSGTQKLQSRNGALTTADKATGGVMAGFTVTAATVDLSVTKTDGVTTVASGATNVYTVVATNQSSYNFADNAVVTDPAVAGLTKTAVGCVAAGGAVCPAGLGVALLESGATIATFPPGGSLTLTVTTTVGATASGSITNTASIAAPAGYTDTNPANNTATDVDTLRATVRLSKVSEGGTGSFAFTLTNAATASDTVTTTTAGVAATSALVNPVTAPGVAVTITEAAAAGHALAGATCSDANGALLGNGGSFGTLAGQVLTIPAANVKAGASITCVFTNTKLPILRLQKSLPAGRSLASDQFSLSIAGPGGPVTATTTGTTNAPSQTATLGTATAGAAYTLSEAAAGGADLGAYTTTYRCTNALAGGQTPGGAATSFGVTPVAGDDLTCTLTNTVIPRADLAVVKTASASSAQAGEVVAFTLSVTNGGPNAANGATVRDTPAAGLDCTQPASTATCSASTGAACPSATVPVASLLDAGGVAIAVLPVGGTVTFTLQCLVTASGIP